MSEMTSIVRWKSNFCSLPAHLHFTHPGGRVTTREAGLNDAPTSLVRVIELFKRQAHNHHRILKGIIHSREEPHICVPPVQDKHSLLTLKQECRRYDEYVIEPRALSQNLRVWFNKWPQCHDREKHRDDEQ